MALETPSRPPPFMANAILNFHFDYLNPSLIGAQCAKPPPTPILPSPGSWTCSNRPGQIGLRHFCNQHDNSYTNRKLSGVRMNSFDGFNSNLVRKRMRGNVREPFVMQDVVRCRDGTAVKVPNHPRQRQTDRQTCTVLKV